MGGVFSEYFTEVLVSVGRAQGWPLARIPLGPTGDVADPAYGDMSEGRIEESDYVSICAARLAAEGLEFNPRTDTDWSLHQRPGTWALIERLHSLGRVQAILTNDASAWMGADWWERWEPARFFASIVDVATLGVRKPHPDAYVAAYQAISRDPGACLFVDDTVVNCRGAEAVGMQSEWFDITNPAASIAALTERLGLS